MKKEFGSIKPLVQELKKKAKKPIPPDSLEKGILDDIRKHTSTFNRNNLTRTKAYLDYYLRNPQIHWSFLAHMVSRNAGWSMTDLKGEWLPRILREDEAETFFHFLERGNWLIFQDAFPQLLLFEEGKKREKNLSHLLPHIQVSRFMQVNWNYYIETQDSTLLSMALIINEQNYIESRLIQDPYYQEQVLSTLQFKLQDILSLNQILFPFQGQGRIPDLLGQTLHQFASLHERIELGKRLYKILFRDEWNRKKVEEWASSHPHTGSRKDYWFHLFNDVKDSVPGMPYKIRIEKCSLKDRTLRIYSPKLPQVWPDIEHKQGDKEDWYKDWKEAGYLLGEIELQDERIEARYCKALEKIDLAIAAQELLYPPHEGSE
ncbi:DUF2515 family protein [Ammoniphilus sp. YIM 78166]|uniref:DUF2515 family protein n=1 Tax=Ammoniphilus sp. YIM 78166 TaxID=1644106 RepID=UPI001F0F1DDD|nr:DUF2515 family protein [Ammoniphilus sp. YIM 78166]